MEPATPRPKGSEDKPSFNKPLFEDIIVLSVYLAHLFVLNFLL